jgi:hypothetical protein
MPIYSDEISSPLPLFVRTQEDKQDKLYSIKMSYNGKYLRIYEPIYTNGVISQEIITIYTLDGKFVHTEVFEYFEPYILLDYWLSDKAITAIRRNANHYTDAEVFSISTIQISDESNVQVTHRYEDVNIVGGAFSSTITLSDTTYLAIESDNTIGFLDLYSHEVMPFIVASESIIQCLSLTTNKTFDGVRVYVTDCYDTGKVIFDAQFTVSINPSGD